jgi:hypothetical protein
MHRWHGKCKHGFSKKNKREEATSQNSMHVEYLLKLAFKESYTAVKWIELAEDYIHLKAFVL